MFEKKLRSIVVVCILAFVMLSAGIVILPSASALTWTQDDDTEFSQGSFTNTEVVGSGPGAYVGLTESNEDWGDLDPVLEPSAREGPAMAFDSARNVYIMFGGYDGSYLADTWEYDRSTNTWTQLTPTGSPSGREWSSVVYDSANGVFVLFGGFGPGGLADTWEYDPVANTWTETTPGFSPMNMYSYALAFDSSADRVILAAQDFLTGVFQTWAYDASLDTWIFRIPPTQPGNRAAHTITYDSSIGRTVLFGGIDGLTYLSDAWEYDYSGDSWTETSPGSGPSGRYGHAAAYRTWDQGVLVYGGAGASGYPIDTWKYEYVSGSPTWTDISPINDPGSRRYPIMDYDSANNATVIIGGYNGFSRVNDTWELAPLYSNQGTFDSSYVDTLYTDTVWQNIWWNLTPAAQPPLTNLSFHLAVSNRSSGPWNFRGPDGTVSTYYTNPGQQIRPGTVGRYLKYRARLISFDGLDTPRMDDVTIVYTIPTLSPRIAWTDPWSGENSVELTRNITVMFSEPMSSGTVTWTILPDPGLTSEWDSAETVLYLNHTAPLEETTVYIVQITGGEDKSGNPLVAGPAPNPWVFVTVIIPPYIEETEPADSAVDVPLDYPIWINFSEPMDTATVQWTIGPDPGGWTQQWQDSNSTLYLTHSADYTQCTPHVVQVTQAKDPKGNDLIVGPVSNPWMFTTVCLDPFIQSTDPAHVETGVAVDYPITVFFSKEVDNTTLAWTISPDPGGWTSSWGPQNLTVVLDHSNPFASCTVYTVEITDIQDLGGGSLIPGPVPNPWTFITTCPNPFILLTDPSDGEQNVPTDQSIVVYFSETMDTTSLAWDIQPSPGGWTEWWIVFNTAVQLNHTNPLGQCTIYTVTITNAEDVSSNPLVPGFAPNPWTFNTTCFSPVITSTSPANNSADVPLTEPIVIDFSEPVDTATLSWNIIPDPDPGAWGESWLNNNQTVELTHPTDYQEATLYVVTVVYVEDEDGNPLVGGPVPNPWVFTTGSANPYITVTDPYDGEIDVELDRTINITFSEAMATGTVTWNINPNPGGWSTQWIGNTILSLSHSNPFAECTVYTFTVTYGEDLAGNPLVPGPAANPFSFATICVSPQIVETYPADGTIDFPVDASLVINFSEPMNTSTVDWIVQPFVGHQGQWSNGNMTLTLDHITPYKECQLYNVSVSGNDTDGNPLVAGPVPNPFYFTPVCDNPFIVVTDPFDGETGVDVWANLIVTFSEEMDTATVTWSISPDPLGWVTNWENGNTVLNLSHSNPYTGGQLYTVEVLTGDDLSGLPLVPGPVLNPWTFTTAVPNPYITVTDPADGATGVPLNKDIIIDFSEEIDTPTFMWTIAPDPTGWSALWSLGNTRVTLSHTVLFNPSTPYTVTVTAADDLDGDPLIAGPVPNPWSFTTAAVPPLVVDTYPADGATGVPINSCIWINFSKQIDTATFMWTIAPDPGGWSEVWTNGNMTVTLCHNTYAEGILYTVTVTAADDMAGNPLAPGPVPNPWNFTTEIIAPWIVDTDPANGAIDVPLDASIIVNFSEPMDTATLIYLVAPDPGGWTVSWLPGDMTLILDHSNPFLDCKLITVTVAADDLQGQPLQAGPVPNPWSFTTVCLAPYITITDPADAAIDVPVDYDITITFSEQIDTPTFMWTISPDPLGWTEFWSGGGTVVTLSHATAFAQCQAYTVTVTAADDMDGNALVAGPVPNPWTFDTVCPVTAPSGLTVTRVFPSTVRLDWNVVPGADSYNIYDSNDRFAAFPGGWNLVNTANNFYEFAHLDDGQTHYYVVRAFNLAIGESGNSTMGVKINKAFTLNPPTMSAYWMSLPYNNEYATASDIANELTETSVNVIAKWDRSKQEVISYYFARGKWRGRDFAIGPGDGIYVSVVATFDWYIVGTDSDITIDMPHTLLLYKNNKHWVSVPYTGIYAQASDIVIDIEGGTGPGTNVFITELGKWDATTLTSTVYYYDPGGWTGDDFVIEPGDGIYIEVVASYNWQPVLLTPEVP